jgi:hypothetical protein
MAVVGVAEHVEPEQTLDAVYHLRRYDAGVPGLGFVSMARR